MECLSKRAREPDNPGKGMGQMLPRPVAILKLVAFPCEQGGIDYMKFCMGGKRGIGRRRLGYYNLV